MNCLGATLDQDEMTAADLAQRDALQAQPLAFTGDESLVAATSRIVVPVRLLGHNKKWQWIFLNVECFEHDTTHAESNLVVYIPGICESAETKSVQQMAQWSKSMHVKLAVVELQGHGLSSGTLGEMTTDLEALVGQVLLALKQAKAKLLVHPDISYVLCGSSLGGTLALYAAEYMSRRWQLIQSGDTGVGGKGLLYAHDLWTGFLKHGKLAGVVAITPAVGVDPDVLPPSWMVSTLTFLSSWAPTAQVPLTPLEDSKHYNCPETTTRNFKGHWPLVTSKFLLDMTSKIVPGDIQGEQLTLRGISRVIILAGAKDNMIPMASLEVLESKLECKQKELVVLPNAGHDVLVNPKSRAEALEHVFVPLLHDKNTKDDDDNKEETLDEKKE